jgi:UDP-glucose 4-epimerase
LRCFVTGCAGFIGSNVADRLLGTGHSVIGYDNLSTGRLSFLREACANPRFQFIEADLLDLRRLTEVMDGSDFVFHLGANADVRFGTEHPTKDLHQNTIATVNVLEAMRATGTKRIAFASTGSVYGDTEVFPTPEHAPFPLQTSLYGASKLAAEAFIEAYSEAFGIQGFIFRFVSILGERYTHGHVVDFYRQLKAHPHVLHVLGNGKQRKSYLYVQDCIDAILMVIEKCAAKVNVLNLGTDEYCEVDDSIRWICGQLGVKPELKHTGGDRGWIGDNPFIFLDCSVVRALGWRPKLTIEQAIVRTVRYLRDNPELLEKHV